MAREKIYYPAAGGGKLLKIRPASDVINNVIEMLQGEAWPGSETIDYRRWAMGDGLFRLKTWPKWQRLGDVRVFGQHAPSIRRYQSYASDSGYILRALQKMDLR